MSKTKKTLEKIQLPLTVALIVYIFADNVDVALLFTKMFSIQITHIFICTMLSILTTAVLAHRMRFLASFLGVHLTNRTAYVSIITAQFYSNFISQIFAHVIARDNLYSRAGGSSINLAFLTLLEKLLSAFIIVIFAVFWASQIFNVKLFDTVFQKVNFYEFCSVIICVVASLVVVKFKAPKFRRFSIKKMRTRPFLGSILCTIISYIFVVSIFVILCWSLKPESETTELLYFATIIMFCASIPVTINGWGTRELSSIYFLNQLGFENSEALAISITVGLIFTAVSIGLFLIAPSSRAAKKTLDKNHPESQTNKLNSLDRAVTYWFTSLAAVLIFFQFHVNVGGQVLNINFADPLAILALCVVLLWCLKTRLPPTWTINRLNLFLVSFLFTTAVALAVGFLTYGSNDWAIFNRALGYFVLLGYASFGVIVMGSQNIYGVKRLLETMSFTAISIIFITTFCNLTLDTKHHFAFGEFRVCR